MKRTSILAVAIIAGCMSNPQGKCLKWKTTEIIERQCTREPYLVCADVPVKKTYCSRREKNNEEATRSK